MNSPMTEHPTDALKPCPFCLGPAVNVGGDYITCGAVWEPGCAGRMVRTDAETWNTRAFRPDPVKVAKLTSLEASGLLPSTPIDDEGLVESLRDTIVGLWHDSNAGHGSLHECLGMTWEEYSVWMNPDAKAKPNVS